MRLLCSHFLVRAMLSAPVSLMSVYTLLKSQHALIFSLASFVTLSTTAFTSSLFNPNHKARPQLSYVSNFFFLDVTGVELAAMHLLYHLSHASCP
jgi:hypothetical protein